MFDILDLNAMTIKEIESFVNNFSLYLYIDGDNESLEMSME